MATARDDLQELSQHPLLKHLENLASQREQGQEGDSELPTVREALAEIGRDPEKYDKILDESGPDFEWTKVYPTQDPLENSALVLLTAARQSGAEPEEYLSRLAPYFDSRVGYDPRMLNASGYISVAQPDTAVVTGTAKALGRTGQTLPHELEHTLQMLRSDDPTFARASRFKTSWVDSDTNFVPRFSSRDVRFGDLQERLDALPPEQRREITDDHPVFGGYLGQGVELMARLRAREMLEAARGEDFYQTEVGQALLPSDPDRAYMVASTLPGVPSATPPWSFERTDKAPTSVEDQRKSYARRLLEMLPRFTEDRQ